MTQCRIRALSLPAVEAGAARRGGAFNGRWPCVVGGQVREDGPPAVPWRVMISPASVCDWPGDAPSCGLRWQGASLVLAATPAAIDQWARAYFPALPDPPLPADWQAAAFQLLQMSLSAAGLDILSAPSEWPLPCVWRVQASTSHAPSSIEAFLRSDERGVRVLAQAASTHGRMPALSLLHLSVTLVWWAGQTSLASNRLLTLRRDDIVLLDVQCHPDGGVPLLGTPNGHAVLMQADPDGRPHRFVITHAWKPIMTLAAAPRPSDDLASTDSALRTAAEAVDVVLTFDVGEHVVTLGELLQWVPGAVIDLTRPVQPTLVRIRAGGKSIGTGELVDVDGVLGVRIQSWQDGSC